MRTSIILCASLWLGAAGAGIAQVPHGVWPGSLQIGGANISVTFTSSNAGGALEAVMRTADGPESAVTDLVMSDDEMRFSWGGFACEATRQGDGFRGRCVTGDGTEAELNLSPPEEQPDGEPAEQRESDANFLTGDDLRATAASDLYEAIERLRPRWVVPLRGGGVAVRRGEAIISTTEVQVFVGRQVVGGVDALRLYELSNIDHVRYLRPRDAIVEFGSRNQGGVIAIALRR